VSSVPDRIRDAFTRAAAEDPPVETGDVVGSVRAAVHAAAAAEAAAAKAAAQPDPTPDEAPLDELDGEPRDRGRLALVAGGVALALALIGGVLAVALTGGDDHRAVVTSSSTVHMYRCPGSEPVGILHKGDAVRSIARSSDNRWLAVRFPDGVADDVWVSTDDVSSDVSPSELPIARCTAKRSVEFATTSKSSDDGPASAPTSTSPNATTTITSNTTTSTLRPTTTTATPTGQPSGGPTGYTPPPPENHKGGSTPPPPPPPTPTTPVVTSPPPTTQPPDTTPPTIASLTATPRQIYENVGTCSASTPKSSSITVSVSDAGGVGSVTMSWKANSSPLADQGGATSRVITSSGGQYSATLGPFGDVPSPGVTLVLTVTAKDAAGNTAKSSIYVTLFSCGA
jgi:hypothetical protein